MHCITSLLLKASWAHGSLENMKNCINFSSWSSFSYIFYFASSCKCQLNDIITFCLLYSLNFPPSNQNPLFFPVEVSVSISSRLTCQWHYTMLRKQFWTLSSLDFTIVMGDRLVSNFDGIYTKFIISLSFPHPQTKSNWVYSV